MKPALVSRYRGYRWRHVGDPAGTQREQTSISRSAVKTIRRTLGGAWLSGPVRIEERIEPLRAILSRTIKGRGLVQVDRQRAKAVRDALRGGWHYHVTRTGLVSGDPRKDIHSHPGDCMGYGAAVLFPAGQLQRQVKSGRAQQAVHFAGQGDGLGFEQPGRVLPQEAQIIKPSDRHFGGKE